MRLLKAQNTNLRSIYGKGVKYDVNDQVIVDSNNVMLVPKGTSGERPSSPVSGHLRYNTTLNELEVYSESEWRSVRYKEPNNDPGIIQQNLGNGDATETVFGPLNSQDPNTDYTAPAAAQNVLVFVENVFQVSGTNYTLEQSDGTNVPSIGPNPPYAAGYYIVFSSPPDLAKPITVLHNFDK
jgi:hypothetical protein